MATKKPIKRAAKPAKTAPVAAAPACNISGGCGCGCRCGFFKKLIVLGLVFAAGFATCHYMCAKHGFRGFHNGMRAMPQDMFVNGCLDTAKISNPAMAEKIATADKDSNGCITMEEMNAHREEMRGSSDMSRKPMMHK
jgi:hypothetical protein